MKTSSSLRFILIGFLIAGSGLLGCREQKRPGELPEITLATYTGDTFTFSPRDQKASLVVFWATWCRPCIMEIPTLVELQEKYGDRNFRVIAINLDDVEGTKTRSIMERFGINYPMLIGSDEISNKFGGVNALPTAFLVGRDGIIKEKIQGMAPQEMLEEKILAQL